MKKILSILLSLLLTMNIGFVSVYAKDLNKIQSVSTPNNVVEYAKEVIEQHYYSVKQDVTGFGFQNTDLTSYKLGNSFTVYNTSNHTILYEFVLLSNSEIVGLLEVYDDGEELLSSLSKSFGEELYTLLKENTGMTYKLVTDSNNVFAVSDTNKIIWLYSIIPNNNNLTINYNDIYTNCDNFVLSDLNTMQTNALNLYSPIMPLGDVNTPLSYKTVEVKGVTQGSKPWCWAATCAALINYYKGKSLTASTVANYVYPSNPDQGATWTEIKKAYNHWGLSPSQTGKITFSKIKTNINNNKPMHLGLTGHSVGLIGYEDWEDRDMLILLEPNGGVKKSVQLKSNGNFNYSLTGNDSWIYTRTF